MADFWQCCEYCLGPEYREVLGMTLVLNLANFCIYQGCEYTTVLNIIGFWIWQGSDYTWSLDIAGFWICHDSECTTILNVPGFSICEYSAYTSVWNMPYFSVYQGSEYDRFLILPGLQRLLNVSEYLWNNSWIFLIMSEYNGMLTLIKLSFLRVVFPGGWGVRKDMPYDNIKSHKKTGFYPLSRWYIFRKITGVQTPKADRLTM